MGYQLTAEEVVQARQMAAGGDVQIQFKFGKILKLYPELGQPNEFRRWLAQAANQGMGQACWELAEVYLHGNIVPKDLAEAYLWLKQGAALKNPECLYNLGVQYHSGAGIPQDYAQALKHFQAAAELGNLDGLYSLAVCFFQGQGAPKNLKIAQELAQGVAATGDKRGASLLAAIDKELHPPTITVNLSAREAGELTRALISQQMAAIVDDAKLVAAETARRAAEPPPVIPVSPLDQLRQRANTGDIPAQVELARTLQQADQLQEAATWLTKAATAGDMEARFMLGNCYLEGRGVERDVHKARPLMQEAAKQGHPLARQAVPQIEAYFAEALATARRLRRAADAGDPQAQFELGSQYARGMFAPADHRTAAQYYEKAAAQNHAGAQLALFVAYERGQGVEKSLPKSHAWLVGAAALGNTDAMYYFARRYAEGTITPASLPSASMIFAKCQRLYPHYLDPAVPKKTFAQLQAGAEAGDIIAIFWLAMAFMHGEGTQKSIPLGLAWLLKGVELGYPQAQLEMARCHALGEGIPVNREKGKQLAILAAKQGHLEARADLNMAFSVKLEDLPMLLAQ